MRKGRDHVTLRSGRTFYAYGGALAPGGDGVVLLYGWDGISYPDDQEGLPDPDAIFTQDEREEIADRIIEEWERWRRGESASWPMMGAR